jgi:hypothetical protein
LNVTQSAAVRYPGTVPVAAGRPIDGTLVAFVTVSGDATTTLVTVPPLFVSTSAAGAQLVPFHFSTCPDVGEVDATGLP